MACADANSTAWLPVLRSFIDKRQQAVEESEVIQGDITTVIDRDTEVDSLIMVPKLSLQVIFFLLQFFHRLAL